MQTPLLCSVVMTGLLLMATPALAVIRATLENPADNQSLSGIQLVSGWAFAENGQPVTVRPRINGVTQGSVIPCCGPRQDVVDANPQAPLDSGFGALINYGALNAGTHTIGVEITAPGNAPVIIEHSVTVARPGDAEFLTKFAMDHGWAAIDPSSGELVIVGAEVEASPQKNVNVRANYAISSQSLVISEAFTQSDENELRFFAVEGIFTNKCATAGCHDGTAPGAPPDLSTGNAQRNTVAIHSTEVPSLLLINPGRPATSYLYQKVIPNGDIAPGTGRMPPGCPDTTPCLSPQEIQAIEDFILHGAVAPGHDHDDDHDHDHDHDHGHSHGWTNH
jgi:hypothetical protein